METVMWKHLYGDAGWFFWLGDRNRQGRNKVHKKIDSHIIVPFLPKNRGDRHNSNDIKTRLQKDTLSLSGPIESATTISKPPLQPVGLLFSKSLAIWMPAS